MKRTQNELKNVFVELPISTFIEKIGLPVFWALLSTGGSRDAHKH